MANITGYDLLEPSRPTSSSVSRVDKATENTIYVFDPTTNLRNFLLTGSTSDGDNVAINGLSNSFRVQTKGNTITLKGIKNTESQGVQVRISMDKTGGTDKLWFADGSVDVTYSTTSGWTVGGKAIGKKADLSKLEYSITESETFAAAETAVGDGNGTSTFTLTTGVDNILGTDGSDTIAAGPGATAFGVGATTLQAFDSVDGGLGTDTMNIYSGLDAAFTGPASIYNVLQVGTVKNVEIINIDNRAFLQGALIGDYIGEGPIDTPAFGNDVNGNWVVDASQFEGATQIWQIGAATDVIELAAGTTAGFRNLTMNWGAGIEVDATSKATSASIALDGVKGSSETENAVILDVDGESLDTINVSGNLKQRVTDKDAPEAYLRLDAVVSATATTIKLNTAVKTELDFDDGADAMTTLDLSGSTGGVEYDTDNQDLAVIGGSGGDYIYVGTSHNKSIALNAGDDTVEFESGASTVGASGSVTGGNGTDTLAFDELADAVLATATDAFSKKVTGFEVLEIRNGINVSDVKVDNLNKNGANNITKLILDDVGASTYSGLLNNTTVQFVDSTNGEDGVDITLNLASTKGTADSINLAFKSKGTDDLWIEDVVISNVENINITTDNSALTGEVTYEIEDLEADKLKNLSINAAAGITFEIDDELDLVGQAGARDVVFNLAGDGDIDFGEDIDAGVGIDSLTINDTGNGDVAIWGVDTGDMWEEATLAYNISGRGDFSVYQQVTSDVDNVSVTVNATNSTGSVTFGDIAGDPNYAEAYGIVGSTVTFNGSAIASNRVVAKVSDEGTFVGGSADDTFMIAATNSSGDSNRASITITTGNGDDQVLIDYAATTSGQVLVTVTDFAAGDTTNIDTAILADIGAIGAEAQDTALDLLVDAGFATEGGSASNVQFLNLDDSLDGKVFTYGGNTYFLVFNPFTGVANSTTGTLDDGEILVKITGIASASVLDVAFVSAIST